jgi:hypothetical protein
MTTTDQIEEQIMHYIRIHSGFETHRNYLGMSHLGNCPRKLYKDFVLGKNADDRIHLGAFSGYSMERIEKELLIGAGIAREKTRELVADFDPLLRGHIDAETIDGDLLEIKSVNTYKFETRIQQKNLALPEHFEQVQVYMHFGGYSKALIVYICRETFQHKVFSIPYSPEVAGRLIRRAKLVLLAIHEKRVPVCECGKCGASPL